MNTMAQFHLAFPATDLSIARGFYGGVLGCPEGQSAARFVDFNFYEHQIVAHLVPEHVLPQLPYPSAFDGHEELVPHFGLNLGWTAWRHMAARLIAAEVRFLQEPHVRLEGRAGEHHCMTLLDPFGNCLEFKRYRNPDDVFTLDDEIAP